MIRSHDAYSSYYICVYYSGDGLGLGDIYIYIYGLQSSGDVDVGRGEKTDVHTVLLL